MGGTLARRYLTVSTTARPMHSQLELIAPLAAGSSGPVLEREASSSELQPAYLVYCTCLDLSRRHHHLPNGAPSSTSTRPITDDSNRIPPLSTHISHPPTPYVDNNLGSPTRWLLDTTELFQVSNP